MAKSGSKKTKTTMADIFANEVFVQNTTVTQLGKMAEEFGQLIPRENGKTKIPEDSEEKQEFFINLVCDAADKGLTRKQIIDNLALLSWKDSSGKTVTLGEKAATTIFRHAVDHMNREFVMEEFPNNKIGDEESDIKRVVRAFWAKDDAVSCQEQTFPLIAVLDYENAFEKFINVRKIGGQIAAYEKQFDTILEPLRLAVERAQNEEQETAAKEALATKTTEVEESEAHVVYSELFDKRAEIVDELKQLALDLRTTVFDRMNEERRRYFNMEKTPTRGRGANLYASIGSEFDFDVDG